MKTIDESAILRFTDNFALKGRQAATIESYRRDSLSFLEYMEAAAVATGDVSPDTLRDFQVYLKNRGFRDNSVRRSVIGVRQFFRFLQDDFGWDRSPFDDSPIPGRDDSFNPRLTPEHLQKLLTAVGSESSALKAARDQVMLLLIGFEGLKAGELIALEWVDFMPSHSTGVLRVKGPRDRTLQIEATTAEALLKFRKATVEVNPSKPIAPRSKIMIGFKGSEASYLLPDLTRHGVKFALYELGKLASIPHLNTEDLRHYAMGHKVTLGFTPEMLMNHLGLRTPGKTSRHFSDEVPTESVV